MELMILETQENLEDLKILETQEYPTIQENLVIPKALVVPVDLGNLVILVTQADLKDLNI